MPAGCCDAQGEHRTHIDWGGADPINGAEATVVDDGKARIVSAVKFWLIGAELLCKAYGRAYAPKPSRSLPLFHTNFGR